MASANVLLPPVNSGGLIEAAPGRMMQDSGSGWLPPVNSGGLIEATVRRSRSFLTELVTAGEFRRPH